MASSIRELRVWQEAVATAGEVTRAARKAGRSDSRPLTDLLVRCSSEVALAIARGYSKELPEAQRAAFQTAREATASLETALAIARHAELLPDGVCADLAARAATTARMVAGYISYLDRQLEAESGVAASVT